MPLQQRLAPSCTSSTAVAASHSPPADHPDESFAVVHQAVHTELTHFNPVATDSIAPHAQNGTVSPASGESPHAHAALETRQRALSNALREFELASAMFSDRADDAAIAAVAAASQTMTLHAAAPLHEPPPRDAAIKSRAPLSAGLRVLLITAFIHSTTSGMTLITGPTLQLHMYEGNESEAAKLNTVLSATLGG